MRIFKKSNLLISSVIAVAIVTTNIALAATPSEVNKKEVEFANKNQNSISEPAASPTPPSVEEQDENLMEGDVLSDDVSLPLWESEE